MRPGMIMGLQWFNVTRYKGRGGMMSAPLFSSMTPLHEPITSSYKLLLPVILEADKWTVNPTLKSTLRDNHGHEVGEPVKGSVIRLGVCTWLGGEVSWSRIAEGLFNPDKFHKLPRVRLCLGVGLGVVGK